MRSSQAEMSFAIDFTDEFTDHGGNRHRIGVLHADSDQNRFESPLDHWTEDDYRRQWAEGLARALAGKPSCLITWMYDPKARYYVQWWELAPKGDKIVITEVMVDLSEREDEFSVEMAYALAAEDGEEDGEEEVEPSRWYVDQEEMKTFYDRNASAWA